MAIKKNINPNINLGLLVIRVGLGIMFIYHGYPKLIGGKESWMHLGASARYVGLNFWPVLWGLLSAVVETVGGVLLILGFLFRPICALILINLIVAAAFHFGTGGGMDGAAHAIEDAIVFIGFLFTGPGKYSLDKK